MCTIWNGTACIYILSTILVGQEILPNPTIQGEAEASVSFTCVSFAPGQASSNGLQIYRPGQGAFVDFEGTPDGLARLTRINEGSFSNYTFGPLTANDDGEVFRCTSSLMSSGNTTIIVICKLFSSQYMSNTIL